mmetsp:Transcript_67/g.118  ORF Transcript_67/g.118 Transcript_67/m.118 type:complete len:238 (+) Transcript_67:34-747(+)|eukprot:CAMPEP_0175137326 /NCGR_PEP_ID=MMETSP0087-20121206/9752_1 /TAXON_ID=136419 /ORGANISM="Unknown Unknown, Strain D1" /LENGTH=237 /DNA_ID=CAMNT_0016420147 /DNA_START=33 /DNA_END=746 /DNA_ORIENTATION=-
MADDTKSDSYARETSFLGFPPVAVIDDVINCVEDYLCDGMDVLEKALTKMETLKPLSSEVGQGVDKLLETASKSVSKSLDKFELYTLQNIFKVPAGVKITEAEGAEAKVYTAEDQAKIEAETAELRKQVKAAKYLNRAMKQEISELDSEVAQCKELLGENTTHGLLGHSPSPDTAATVSTIAAGSKELQSKVLTLQSLVGEPSTAGLNLNDPAVNFQRDQGVLPLSADQMKGAASGF